MGRAVSHATHHWREMHRQGSVGQRKPCQIQRTAHQAHHSKHERVVPRPSRKHITRHRRAADARRQVPPPARQATVQGAAVGPGMWCCGARYGGAQQRQEKRPTPGHVRATAGGTP